LSMLERPALKRIATCFAAFGCFGSLAGFGELPTMREFPGVAAQNDALCRSYGYAPGTHLYRLCRERKDQISTDSRAASVPDVTPIPLLLFLDKRPAW
jgi:hypothetical protein